MPIKGKLQNYVSNSVYNLRPSLSKFSTNAILDYMDHRNRRRNCIRIQSSVFCIKKNHHVKNMYNLDPMEVDYGPRPMRDMKKAEKTPNAVDRMKAEQQGEHDKMSKEDRERDRVAEVHEHNATYPKLKVQLDKRKSLLRIKEHTCGGSKRRPYNNSRYQSKRRLKFKRIRKKKPMRNTRNRKRTTRNHQNNNHYVSLGVQCGVELVDKICSVANFNAKIFSRNESVPMEGRIKSGKKDRNRNRSDLSMSSYNSFASLDHEPMV